MKRYYWDTCIFITWLKNENHTPGLLEGIEAVLASVEKKKEACIITSVITHAEMLRCKFTGDNFDKFKDLFKRPDIIPCEVTENIAILAGELRDHYGNQLTTPDAIHLATAIYFEVDEIHTSDGSGKKSGLARYDGLVADKYKMNIKQPLGDQYNLLTYIKPNEQKET